MKELKDYLGWLSFAFRTCKPVHTSPSIVQMKQAPNYPNFRFVNEGLWAHTNLELCWPVMPFLVQGISDGDHALMHDRTLLAPLFLCYWLSCSRQHLGASKLLPDAPLCVQPPATTWGKRDHIIFANMKHTLIVTIALIFQIKLHKAIQPKARNTLSAKTIPMRSCCY